MRVALRIRTSGETRVHPHRRVNRHLASFGASVILPVALFCFLMCAWRWGYELSWTGRFPVGRGLLAHWQTWFVFGVVWQAVGMWLWRYANVTRTGLSGPAPRRAAQIP